VNYYHLKSDDDRVYKRISRSKYTHAFRTEISAMSSATGWSESKCVNYVHRKLQEKDKVAVEVAATFKFNNRLIYK
tara:strand:- start:3736 stop:3963 length:228 start_codon:yes stop_codon:yes gene_type:complete